MLISVSTWLTPQPSSSIGLLVNYGSQQLIEDQAWYRGYDLEGYWERCGIASISPAHLGQVAWVRTDGEWLGPCLVVDVMARHHFYRGVYWIGEVAEVPRWVASKLRFENGVQGEVWFGRCPPEAGTVAGEEYRPPLLWDWGDTQPIFWPFPPQQLPGICPEYN